MRVPERSTPVRVFSDYVCPYCFLAERPLAEALEAVGLDTGIVDWRPFELRPEPVPTLRPEDAYLQSVWPAHVYPLAERLGVPIVLPRVSPQPYTRLAFEGHLFAAERGLGHAYTGRMFRAFFQEERDIGDLDVLTGLAAALGLDAAAYRAALAEGRYRAAHQARLREARETYRVSVVPTFIIGERRIEGVPGVGALVDALQRLAH